MSYSFLADTVVSLHLFFVLFVVLGGVAALCWPRLAWLHIPAAVWGVLVELGGWNCPLTNLENHLRRLGNESGYSVTFIEHYLEPLLYPLGLTRCTQLLFGLAVLCINLAAYGRFWFRRRGSATASKTV